jgi:hypothetical protein
VDISLADTKKAVVAQLAKRFPDKKFRVLQKKHRSCNLLEIHWTGKPTGTEVGAVTRNFQTGINGGPPAWFLPDGSAMRADDTENRPVEGAKLVWWKADFVELYRDGRSLGSG